MKKDAEKKHRGIIRQFNLVIYPVDFVVVIGEMEDEVNRLYMPYEDAFKEAYIAPPKFTGATCIVREEATGIPCIMIWIGKTDEFTSSIIAHECGHAALEIWRYIGSEVALDNQEPFCYLLGNLVRLAVGCFYEIPGIKPPVIGKGGFEDKKVKDLRNKKNENKKH